MADSDFVQDNAKELQRLRDLVARLSEEELHAPVNEHWTVAGVLGHAAFWDARALYVDWINDSTRALIHAIDPRRAAELTIEIAETIDARVAELPADKLWPNDPDSPLNGRRASHRAEHLDEIEAALG
jgi:hypothetical protein